MKFIILFSFYLITQTPMTLFDFNSKSDISNWRTVDDVVMGGRSNGNFKINDAGYGLFYGEVSLENNGGFSMVQYHFETKKVNTFSKVCIRLKGDGKSYQFRVKTNTSDNHSYVTPFNTSGDWETIEIPFKTLSPAFRGRKLNIPNYDGSQMEMLAFLIGNKKAESFSLEIDSIILK
ncbi:CIA30 family protein [uncultured Algibacter sp.]|uniref:CIA30 family protein n=1 Tax=uncultured Algibacter sp. TaxID=298659 RepID=UPI00261D6D18|nr:CIA30 family protein [uncultured Algibacter sp.]